MTPATLTTPLKTPDQTDLKKEWCSTHTFHRRFAALWFSSLNPMVDSNWSNWSEGTDGRSRSGGSITQRLSFLLLWCLTSPGRILM